MRHLLILPMIALASPAAACDMDGMFGFNHYAQANGDAAAAEAMRESAIAQARDNFMARHGIAQDDETASGRAGPAVATPVDAAVNRARYGTPQ